MVMGRSWAEKAMARKKKAVMVSRRPFWSLPMKVMVAAAIVARTMTRRPIQVRSRPEEFFLGHVVLRRFIGGFGTGPHEQGHRVLFGLVDLDLGLMALDHALPQGVGLLGFLGNLAQGHDGVLVVVAIHGQLATGGNFTRPMSGEHHQFEPVRNLVNAVFNRHTGHWVTPIRKIEPRLLRVESGIDKD